MLVDRFRPPMSLQTAGPTLRHGVERHGEALVSVPLFASSAYRAFMASKPAPDREAFFHRFEGPAGKAHHRFALDAAVFDPALEVRAAGLRFLAAFPDRVVAQPLLDLAPQLRRFERAVQTIDTFAHGAATLPHALQMALAGLVPRDPSLAARVETEIVRLGEWPPDLLPLDASAQNLREWVRGDTRALRHLAAFAGSPDGPYAPALQFPPKMYFEAKDSYLKAAEAWMKRHSPVGAEWIAMLRRADVPLESPNALQMMNGEGGASPEVVALNRFRNSLKFGDPPDAEDFKRLVHEAVQWALLQEDAPDPLALDLDAYLAHRESHEREARQVEGLVRMETDLTESGRGLLRGPLRFAASLGRVDTLAQGGGFSEETRAAYQPYWSNKWERARELAKVPVE